jgi:hypothetical protein
MEKYRGTVTNFMSQLILTSNFTKATKFSFVYYYVICVCIQLTCSFRFFNIYLVFAGNILIIKNQADSNSQLNTIVNG